MGGGGSVLDEPGTVDGLAAIPPILYGILRTPPAGLTALAIPVAILKIDLS